MALPPDRPCRKQRKPGLSALSLSLKVRLWKIDSAPRFRRLLLRLGQCDRLASWLSRAVGNQRGNIQSDRIRPAINVDKSDALSKETGAESDAGIYPESISDAVLSRPSAVHYNSNPSAKIGASVGSP